jgi:hypothetical protein
MGDWNWNFTTKTESSTESSTETETLRLASVKTVKLSIYGTIIMEIYKIHCVRPARKPQISNYLGCCSATHLKNARISEQEFFTSQLLRLWKRIQVHNTTMRIKSGVLTHIVTKEQWSHRSHRKPAFWDSGKGYIRIFHVDEAAACLNGRFNFKLELFSHDKL